MTLLSRLTEVLQQIGSDVRGILPRLLPAGGTAAQVLTKVDGTDYHAAWADAPAGYTDAQAVAALRAVGDNWISVVFEVSLDPSNYSDVVLTGPTPSSPYLVRSATNVFAVNSGLYLLAPAGVDPTLSGYFELPPGEVASSAVDGRIYSTDGRLWCPPLSLGVDPGDPTHVLVSGPLGFVAQTIRSPHPDLVPIPVLPTVGVAGFDYVVTFAPTDALKIRVFKNDGTSYLADFHATGLSGPVGFRIYTA